jgi:hypothetical protein
VEAVGHYISSEKVDCDFILTRAFDVQLGHDVCRNVKSGYRALEAAGSPAVQKTFAVPDKYAEKVCIDGTLAQRPIPAFRTAIGNIRVAKGFRSQRGQECLLLHCWSLLAISTDSPHVLKGR